MSAASGINGWSNPSKAKKAYLRRHGVRTVEVADGMPQVPPARPSPAASSLSFGGGLASMS